MEGLPAIRPDSVRSCAGRVPPTDSRSRSPNLVAINSMTVLNLFHDLKLKVSKVSRLRDVNCNYLRSTPLIPYFAAKKVRSFGGAASATSCQVEILSLVRNATGFTHSMTAYQAPARSGRRASTSTQNEHCRA